MTSLLAAATLHGLAARWLPIMLDATIKKAKERGKQP
jgi:hypothetical protein